MSSFSKPVAFLLIAMIFGWLLLMRSWPEFTGVVRILYNLGVLAVTVWLMWAIWSRSAWNPNRT